MANKSDINIPAILVTAAILALLGVLGFLLWAIVNVLFMVFLGILLAIVMRFAASQVQRYTPIPHPWSLGVVLVVAIVVISISMVQFVPALVTQMEQLVDQVQVASDQLREFLTEGPLEDQLPEDFLEDLERQRGLPEVDRLLDNLATTFTEGFGILANLLFIIFTALFVAIDPRRYRQGLVRLVPPQGRHRANEVIDHIVSGLKSWLVGRLLSMVLLAVVVSVGLQLMGIPLALALGVLTGLLEFIPVVGPVLSSVPAILMGFTVSPLRALYVAIFYLVVQQLEGNVITPIVQLQTASLPPVLTLTAVLAMGVLFGPLGVLVATPIAVVLLILVQELYIHDVLERRSP